MLDGAILNYLDILQVGTKSAPADARDLPTNPAQVLGLATTSDLVAKDRSLATYGALHAHSHSLLLSSLQKTPRISDLGNLSIPVPAQPTSRAGDKTKSAQYS
jgi:hypothetical protein